MRWKGDKEEISVLNDELTADLGGDVVENCKDHDHRDTAGAGCAGAGAEDTLNVAMVDLTFCKSVLPPLSVKMSI